MSIVDWLDLRRGEILICERDRPDDSTKPA
jgi:hypothetical protein